MNVVIFSHAHPVFSKGGAELAAYYLWQGINDHAQHRAWFVGRVDPAIMPKHTALSAIGERNYLLASNAGSEDLTASIGLGYDSDLAQLLSSADPDVVHFHHYVHLGVELIRLVKNVCPRARVVVTLHEYISICMNNGQMVKTDGRLCHRYSPRECHLCFPQMSPEDIFLREQYIKSFFGLVDRFISPSEFLRNRYIAWGLDASKIDVIENGLPEGSRIPPRKLSSEELRGRFAYFGQINPYKGVDLIIEAFRSLPKSARKKVSLSIFGSGLADQDPEFKARVADLVQQSRGTVKLHGAYEPEEMPKLMRDIDWLVMGSVWWENSPLVIQEAFKYGRPVICPDIGGMAEKVDPGFGGLHYRARDSLSLASVIQRVVDEPGLFESLHRTLPQHMTISSALDYHLCVYQMSGGNVQVGSVIALQ